MKYYKIINGQLVIRDDKNIIIYKDNKQIINPSEKLIIEDGWQIYTTESNDITDQLSMSINNLIDIIREYDKSRDIEEFYIDDISLWLDRDERAILQRRFEIELKNDINISTLWKDGIRFDIKIIDGMKMLDELELYAIKCFDTTNMHINNVKQLKNIEDIKHYDYRTDYPEKLHFNLTD